MADNTNALPEPATAETSSEAKVRGWVPLGSGGRFLASRSSDATQPTRNENPSRSFAAPRLKKPSVVKDYRTHAEKKMVGLKNYGLDKSTVLKRQQPVLPRGTSGGTTVIGAHKHLPKVGLSIEEMEEQARAKAVMNPFALLFLGNLAALRVMAYYLITLETIISAGLTVGLVLYWYNEYEDDETWSGGSLDFILLSFVVISPISAAIGMAYTRRERALVTIAMFRGFSYHLYLGHCLWDWDDGQGRAQAADMNWVEHCDAVLAQLIGIGDELSRFLSLPTTSRSRHKMTRQGRREAARTIEVAYHLVESMTTQRMTRLSLYAERIKKVGLPSGELSRLRQYERFISDSLEQLRMVKMYRTPQALRSFARLFTVLLPPFYAPAFATVARETNSLGIGIANGVIVAVALTGLYLALEVLEDPFTAFLGLDGIDVREEFEVLHFAQLVHTRDLVFPDAPAYPVGRRAALAAPNVRGTHHTSPGGSLGGTVASIGIGKPPVQPHHHRYASRAGSIPKVIGGEATPFTLPPYEELVEDQPDVVWDQDYSDAELGMPLEREETVRESYLLETLRAHGSNNSSNHTFRRANASSDHSSKHTEH